MNRTLHLSLASLACLAVALLASCELPQNQGNGNADAKGDTAETTGEIRTWRMLRLVDKEDAATSVAPGPDIDAIVAFNGDTFLFAGCVQATLFDVDSTRYPENLHGDVDAATLSVHEDDIGTGFLSLAGGTLLCQLPLPVQTGDTLIIWELDGDGNERWEAAFAESAGGTYEAAQTFDGTNEFTVP